VTETGRTRWTDDRMDDLALGLREEIRELRAEMREGFRDLREEVRGVRGEIGGLRAETHADVRSLYGEIGLNRRLLVSLWVTSVLGFAGLIVETNLR
jgi:hypothetical protein